MVNGRPRKTQEELDQEMEDYWGANAEAGNEGVVHGAEAQNGNGEALAPAVAAEDDGDIDMIE